MHNLDNPQMFSQTAWTEHSLENMILIIYHCETSKVYAQYNTYENKNLKNWKAFKQTSSKYFFFVGNIRSQFFLNFSGFGNN